ncbi:helix-turn-helix transcriptional regulator [Kitasatospora paracochleata]|uniref:Transcriptional regulator with XRE-family HTH domain n=1 Tax=Kitasatospora paracochleata TaxID=58354 RepID=A0ABT1IZF7_9ACTN|nr:helix-turn-helix transcriptional regulator [Kitasatospora paracochleata]MCP2310399.1 transcriptional regulator with XRE-family HTH domain [Kitasatospora paracochleata]
MSVIEGAARPHREQRQERRAELSAFLKACRARVRPEDVGLPPGPRRRTPGLRREEVAQLAGVGVTWYTWLEQGRPINASEQVLAAVARTLRLDTAERDHLFRLAEVRTPQDGPASPTLDRTSQVILDALSPLPAAICNGRFDILLHNAAYDALFPGATRPRGPGGRRNSMWCAFTVPDCCNPFLNRDAELPRMVGVLRGGYGRHVGEPAWEEFLRDLCEASPAFRELWARQEVAPPRNARKVFRHAAVGELRFEASYLTIPAAPECYLVVYTPESALDRERMERLVAGERVPPVDHVH